LSRILCDRESEFNIFECFLDEQLYAIHLDPWYADIVNYLISIRIPKDWTKNNRDIFFDLMRFFAWDDPYLFKYCYDQFFIRHVLDHEMRSVLSFYYDQAYGLHYSGRKVATKVL